jgi:hypothetical protein
MGVCVTFFGTKYVWKFADEKCNFESLGVREKFLERFLLFSSYFLEFLLIFKKFWNFELRQLIGYCVFSFFAFFIFF